MHKKVFSDLRMTEVRKQWNNTQIKGGNPLVGEVEIGGAKNAALPILAASVMTDETVYIENMPDVRDTNVLLSAMEKHRCDRKENRPSQSDSQCIQHQ